MMEIHFVKDCEVKIGGSVKACVIVSLTVCHGSIPAGI